MRTRVAAFVAVVQSILWGAHGLVYSTGLAFLGVPGPEGLWILRGTLGLLSVSFVAASVVAFRTPHAAARLLYRVAAIWLGLLSFLFFASVLSWAAEGCVRGLGIPLGRRPIGLAALGLAFLGWGAALANANWIRVRRISLGLPQLPPSWKGRVVGLVSDVHLGHVRNRGFLRRLIRLLAAHAPDILFVPGDLFDGTAVDARALAEPWKDLRVPLGTFFVTGNHEEFGDPARFIDSLAEAGVRVLRNERVEVDGLQVVGIEDGTHRDPASLRQALDRIPLDPSRASVLLAHSPVHLAQAERKGFSLQVSGHTHGGQFVPFTWIVSWIYGKFAKGLARWGNLWVYTTPGAGTWGPPLRLGADPEIVLIRLE